ncbi:MAG: cupin domain-containing protein [Candidatus Riflebacteria bacterium]|nr:cupin domain-containing protein [Candidatus Riflebacteria bacterium]
MTKIVLPGFEQSLLVNRFFPATEKGNEAINIEGCDVQTFSLEFPPGTKRPAHKHDEYRITFVRAGTMAIEMEGKVLNMVPGDFMTTLPQTLHSLEVTSSEPLSIVEIVVPVSPGD